MHDTHNYEHSGLYRSRSGVLLGVIKGLAQHLDFSVGWLRFFFIVGVIFTGVWPLVILYFAAAMLMRPEPAVPLESMEDEEFYRSYVSSRGMALHRLKQTYDSLERRIRRMEDIVTAPDYDWERRFHA